MVSHIRSDPKVFTRLHRALRRIKGIEKTTSSDWTVQKGLQVSVFSDSIAISGEPSRFRDVWWTAGWLQADLLYDGVLLRGGISVGDTHHSNGILYGDGMLRAYRIESSAAVYPRIVIDPCLLGQVMDRESRFFARDFDGLHRLNIFAFDAMAPRAQDLAADGWCPRECYFEEVRQHIIDGIATATQVDHRAKWSWIASRFDEAISSERLRSSKPILS